MAKPYKLTQVELAILPMEHFEDNLSKFNNNENFADDKNYFCFIMHFEEWTKRNPIM